MKFTTKLLGFILLFFVQICFITETKSASTASAAESWKNFYGVGWYGGADESVAYAKQMGYDYLALVYTNGNRVRYNNNPNRAGLKYFILEPEVLQDMVPVVSHRRIRTTWTYTPEQIAFYQNNMVWRNTDYFPRNVETGWHFSGTDFRPNWDFQQQRVIDYVVNQFVIIARSYENQSIGFTFAGYLVDVPRLSGEFHLWNGGSNSFNCLYDLTADGRDSGVIHPIMDNNNNPTSQNITQDYPTYTDARAAFYKQLNNRLAQEFPGFKRILEPNHVYRAHARDEYVWQVSPRPDRDELTPDMLSQEASGTEFVDDNNNFNSGMKITKDMVGISQPNDVGERENRLYAAKAGINGAWYNWYGRFGGTGTMPRWGSITDVYPRLKLIRCIPNWDNLTEVPLSERSWNNSTTNPVYQSPRSYFDANVMYSRHWKTGKLFAVFNTQDGVIRLNAGETVTSVQRVDNYFIEAGDGSADVTIMGDQITLNPGVVIPIDTTNNQVRGVGYIFTLSSGTAPTVSTGSAIDVTSNSATLTGLVNANGLPTEVWFESGITSGSYDSKSSAQSVSGTGDINVSAGVNGLLEGRTYYYRIAAQNIVGITYGSEMSFTTQDTTAPNCSISINNGADYTNATPVTLALSATDNVGVTGYYLSTNITPPLASDSGWTSVTSTTSYNGNASYTLSDVDGVKTVYVWYKDEGGNVSSAASDSITLDGTVPTVTITSPTSNPNYATTSLTLTLRGNASDSTGVVNSVTWSNSRGGSGTASGTTNWTIDGINLLLGDNIITVTARDGINNTGADTITVSVSENTFNTSGLRALYAFSEGSGTVATDTSGNVINGTISGATWTTGIIGGGLGFNGVNNYLSVPCINNNEVSVSAWFYKNANDTKSADAIFGAWRHDSNIQLREGFDLRFPPSAPNTIEFLIMTRNSSGSRQTGAVRYNFANSVGSWHHVVGTYNRTTGAQRLYINGQPVSTENLPAGNTIVPLTYYSDMRIGHSRLTNGYFNGTLDNVRLYNRAISDQEVLDLYNSKS